MRVQPEEATKVTPRFFSIAVGVAAVHFLSGIVILINAKALHTTPLSLLSYVLSERPWAISFVLIATSILAVLPFVLKPQNHLVFMLLVAPQQILLVAHFASAFLAIMFGQYPDGYTPDGGSAFIFVDQVWLLMVAVVFTSLNFYVEARIVGGSHSVGPEGAPHGRMGFVKPSAVLDSSHWCGGRANCSLLCTVALPKVTRAI